jgi:hypothetical protein
MQIFDQNLTKIDVKIPTQKALRKPQATPEKKNGKYLNSYLTSI